MPRRRIRSNGRLTTNAERCRRWRAKKKALAKARREAERQAKRFEVNDRLGILPLAVADVSEADLASVSVDAIITDPPYA